MWVLQEADPDSTPLLFRLSPGSTYTIGRAPDADLILDAALVSRLHCRLEAGEDGVDVIDLESTNGTFVNGTRIERGRLTNGDLLRVGRVELKISLPQ